MKIHIESKVTISTSIDSVWAILGDFNQYPTWSPTVKQFISIPIVGRRSRVRLEQPNGSGITMNPLFINIVPLKELRWKGSLFIPGLFDGEHYFTIEKKSDHETLLIQGEHFSGILVYFFRKMIYGATLDGFNLFNEAIKKRAEEQDLL